MEKRHFFLYGTLQPQAGTAMGGWIAARLSSARPATIAGRLYGIKGEGGWFPALLPAKSAQWVRGTLCELWLKPGERAFLDRYEGLEYRRIGVSVLAGDKVRISAQAWGWRIALPRDALPIPEGHFLDWLASTRRRSFSARSRRL